MGLPQSGKIIGIPVVLEPTLLLDKGDEHEPVEEALRVKALSVLVAAKAGDCLFHFLKYPPVLMEEFLRDRLNIERLVVPLLDGKRRQPEEVLAYVGKVEQRDPFRSGTELLEWANGDAPEEPPFLRVVVVLDVEKVEVLLAGVGEDEERVRMLLQKSGDNRALVADQQLVGGQPCIDDVKSVRAGGEQDGIVGQQAGNALLPTAPGKRLVHPVVIQFAPEELLERLKSLEFMKQIVHGLLTLRLWLRQFGSPCSRPVAQSGSTMDCLQCSTKRA